MIRPEVYRPYIMSYRRESGHPSMFDMDIREAILSSKGLAVIIDSHSLSL